jgi:hypothetical protein
VGEYRDLSARCCDEEVLSDGIDARRRAGAECEEYDTERAVKHQHG